MKYLIICLMLLCATVCDATLTHKVFTEYLRENQTQEAETLAQKYIDDVDVHELPPKFLEEGLAYSLINSRMELAKSFLYKGAHVTESIYKDFIRRGKHEEVELLFSFDDRTDLKFNLLQFALGIQGSDVRSLQWVFEIAYKEGISIDDFEICKHTALTYFLESKEMTLVSDLVTKYKVDVDKVDASGYSPLQIALKMLETEDAVGHVEGLRNVILLFLHNGDGKIAFRGSSSGETLLTWLLKREDVHGIIEYLLDAKGVNINQTNDNGETPLEISLRFRGTGDYFTTEKLLERDADPKQRLRGGETLLTSLLKFKDWKMMKDLPGLSILANQMNAHHETPLSIAVAQNNLDACKFLVHDFEADINGFNGLAMAKASNNATVTHHTGEYKLIPDYVDVFFIFLNLYFFFVQICVPNKIYKKKYIFTIHGRNYPQYEQSNGNNYLYIGRQETMQILGVSGFGDFIRPYPGGDLYGDFVVETKGVFFEGHFSGTSVFHLSDCQAKIVASRIQIEPMNIYSNCPNQDIIIITDSYEELDSKLTYLRVKTLLDLGADGNIVFKTDVIPIIPSVTPTESLPCPTGVTPLYIFTQNGHLEIVDALLKSGVDVNKTGNDTSMLEAALNEITDSKIIEKLLEHKVDPFGNGALSEYLKRKSKPSRIIVQLLLDYGISMNSGYIGDCALSESLKLKLNDITQMILSTNPRIDTPMLVDAMMNPNYDVDRYVFEKTFGDKEYRKKLLLAAKMLHFAKRDDVVCDVLQKLLPYMNKAQDKIALRNIQNCYIHTGKRVNDVFGTLSKDAVEVSVGGGAATDSEHLKTDARQLEPEPQLEPQPLTENQRNQARKLANRLGHKAAEEAEKLPTQASALVGTMLDELIESLLKKF